MLRHTTPRQLMGEHYSAYSSPLILLSNIQRGSGDFHHEMCLTLAAFWRHGWNRTLVFGREVGRVCLASGCRIWEEWARTALTAEVGYSASSCWYLPLSPCCKLRELLQHGDILTQAQPFGKKKEKKRKGVGRWSGAGCGSFRIPKLKPVKMNTYVKYCGI